MIEVTIQIPHDEADAARAFASMSDAFGFPHKTRVTKGAAYAGRLEFDPDVSESSPVVVGTWVTVSHIVSLVVDGWDREDILRTHPELTREDIRAALTYASESEWDDEPRRVGGRVPLVETGGV